MTEVAGGDAWGRAFSSLMTASIANDNAPLKNLAQGLFKDVDPTQKLLELLRKVPLTPAVKRMFRDGCDLNPNWEQFIFPFNKDEVELLKGGDRLPYNNPCKLNIRDKLLTSINDQVKSFERVHHHNAVEVHGAQQSGKTRTFKEASKDSSLLVYHFNFASPNAPNGHHRTAALADHLERPGLQESQCMAVLVSLYEDFERMTKKHSRSSMAATAGRLPSRLLISGRNIVEQSIRYEEELENKTTEEQAAWFEEKCRNQWNWLDRFRDKRKSQYPWAANIVESLGLNYGVLLVFDNMSPQFKQNAASLISALNRQASFSWYSGLSRPVPVFVGEDYFPLRAPEGGKIFRNAVSFVGYQLWQSDEGPVSGNAMSYVAAQLKVDHFNDIQLCSIFPLQKAEPDCSEALKSFVRRNIVPNGFVENVLRTEKSRCYTASIFQTGPNSVDLIQPLNHAYTSIAWSCFWDIGPGEILRSWQSSLRRAVPHEQGELLCAWLLIFGAMSAVLSGQDQDKLTARAALLRQSVFPVPYSLSELLRAVCRSAGSNMTESVTAEIERFAGFICSAMSFKRKPLSSDDKTFENELKDAFEMRIGFFSQEGAKAVDLVLPIRSPDGELGVAVVQCKNHSTQVGFSEMSIAIQAMVKWRTSWLERIQIPEKRSGRLKTRSKVRMIIFFVETGTGAAEFVTLESTEAENVSCFHLSGFDLAKALPPIFGLGSLGALHAELTNNPRPGDYLPLLSCLNND